MGSWGLYTSVRADWKALRRLDLALGHKAFGLNLENFVARSMEYLSCEIQRGYLHTNFPFWENNLSILFLCAVSHMIVLKTAFIKSCLCTIWAGAPVYRLSRHPQPGMLVCLSLFWQLGKLRIREFPEVDTVSILRGTILCWTGLSPCIYRSFSICGPAH